jgi:hypothetical protein
MTQPLTHDEYNSIQESAQSIGEFLEATGKTDMAELSYEEWLDFIAFAYTEICDRNRAKWAKPDGVPF